MLEKTDETTLLSPKAAGGLARAKALTAARRKAIAKKGALARWGEAKQPKAIKDGTLKIGGQEIPCFVLEDGRRVLSNRGLLGAIGLKRGGSDGTGGDRLVSFLTGNAVSRFVSKPLTVATSEPIRFSMPQGGTAHAYEARILVDLCEAVLQARATGALNIRQEHIASQCEILVRGLAHTGIVALVDEATGYQAVRPQDALQKYLELILRKELAAWSKKFPDEFYENIYKLRAWPWPGMGKNRYSAVAGYTRDLVYERIAPGLLKELEELNPKHDSRGRKNKLHQWLTDDVGNPMLTQHLHSLIMFQRLAIRNGYGWKRFVGMVDQVLPKRGQTLQLQNAPKDE